MGRKETDGRVSVGEMLAREWELKPRAQLISLQERVAWKRKVN